MYGLTMTVPLYVQIRREIEAKIRAGDLPPGARLPTEKDLSTQHGVSRATAQGSSTTWPRRDWRSGSGATERLSRT
jgi:DNA-binding transcriptional MocR family regulator